MDSILSFHIFICVMFENNIVYVRVACSLFDFYFDDFVNNPHRRACKMVEHMKTHILGKKISSVKTFLIFFYEILFIPFFAIKHQLLGKIIIYSDSRKTRAQFALFSTGSCTIFFGIFDNCWQISLLGEKCYTYDLTQVRINNYIHFSWIYLHHTQNLTEHRDILIDIHK